MTAAKTVVHSDTQSAANQPTPCLCLQLTQHAMANPLRAQLQASSPETHHCGQLYMTQGANTARGENPGELAARSHCWCMLVMHCCIRDQSALEQRQQLTAVVASAPGTNSGTMKLTGSNTLPVTQPLNS
jgi:hypothetical protein